MVKKINLTDTSSAPPPIEQSNGSDPEMTGSMINLLSQMDWKLWEIYKTAKRFEKLFEADQITLDE
tara:strand:+ start:877 stop:1074 length:198 start_codon:yes stop_codon:yes gene_type:complete